MQLGISALSAAELHLLSTGLPCFGMKIQNLPSDHWIDQEQALSALKDKPVHARE